MYLIHYVHRIFILPEYLIPPILMKNYTLNEERSIFGTGTLKMGKSSNVCGGCTKRNSYAWVFSMTGLDYRLAVSRKSVISVDLGVSHQWKTNVTTMHPWRGRMGDAPWGRRGAAPSMRHMLPRAFRAISSSMSRSHCCFSAGPRSTTFTYCKIVHGQRAGLFVFPAVVDCTVIPRYYLIPSDNARWRVARWPANFNHLYARALLSLLLQMHIENDIPVLFVPYTPICT